MLINHKVHSSKLIEFPNLPYRVDFSFFIFFTIASISLSKLAFYVSSLAISFSTNVRAFYAKYKVANTFKSEETNTESIAN